MVLIDGQYYVTVPEEMYPLYFCSKESRRQYCYEKFGLAIQFELDKLGFERFVVLNGQQLAQLGYGMP